MVSLRKKGESHQTLLVQTMRDLKLRPTAIVRIAARIAGSLGVPSISRSQLGRLMSGKSGTTPGRRFIVWAACSEASGAPLRLDDLFPVEAPTASWTAGASAVALLHGSPRSAPLSSARTTTGDVLTIAAPDETGEPDDVQQLYAEHRVVMRGVAMRRYGVPPDDAEALVHDAFLDYLQRPTRP